MNTIGSVYYGWAFLILCGGGSYYFAKRSINADRAERQAIENERRARQNRQMAAGTFSSPAFAPPHPLPASAPPSSSEAQRGQHVPEDGAGGGASPSAEASEDPAPGGGGGGKFEAVAPFRSRKGDRFS